MVLIGEVLLKASMLSVLAGKLSRYAFRSVDQRSAGRWAALLDVGNLHIVHLNHVLSKSFFTIVSSPIRSTPFVLYQKRPKQQALKFAYRWYERRWRPGWAKKIARLYGRPSRVEYDAIYFVLKRECLLQEQRVFASLEDIAFSRRGRPLHGLSKRGDHCSSRSALRAFRKRWTQRQFSRLVDDKSQNGPNFV